MVTKKITKLISILSALSSFFSCHRATSSQQEMIDILQNLDKKNNSIGNVFRPGSKIAYCDSLLKLPGNKHNTNILAKKAQLLLQAGQEQKSVDIYEDIAKRMDSAHLHNI